MPSKPTKIYVKNFLGENKLISSHTYILWHRIDVSRYQFKIRIASAEACLILLSISILLPPQGTKVSLCNVSWNNNNDCTRLLSSDYDLLSDRMECSTAKKCVLSSLTVAARNTLKDDQQASLVSQTRCCEISITEATINCTQTE